jgi:hypothetical protein
MPDVQRLCQNLETQSEDGAPGGLANSYRFDLEPSAADRNCSSNLHCELTLCAGSGDDGPVLQAAQADYMHDNCQRQNVFCCPKRLHALRCGPFRRTQKLRRLAP